MDKSYGNRKRKSMIIKRKKYVNDKLFSTYDHEKLLKEGKLKIEDISGLYSNKEINFKTKNLKPSQWFQEPKQKYTNVHSIKRSIVRSELNNNDKIDFMMPHIQLRSKGNGWTQLWERQKAISNRFY